MAKHNEDHEDNGKAEAIALAKIAVQDGHAIRFTVSSDKVEVESDSGWQVWWPEEDTYNPMQVL